MATLKELLARAATVNTGSTSNGMSMCNRIMTLPNAELYDETQATCEEGQASVLHVAAGWGFPLKAFARLIDDAGADIDVRDENFCTAITRAAYGGHDDIVRYLANRKADLSIVNSDGFNVYTTIGISEDTSQEEKSLVYRALAEHGVRSGKIREGFRSTLNASTLIPPSWRLAQEVNMIRLFISAMYLSIEELEEQAKERCYVFFDIPLMLAAEEPGMEEPLKRLQSVWCESVNTTSRTNCTAIMRAAYNCIAANVHTLATMGSDLSLKSSQDGDNLFDLVQLCEDSNEMKAETLAALVEHGVTSTNVPPGFQSPLYFRSIYYERNVKLQRWINRKEFLMCANHLYNWSVENQIESEYYRTLPEGLSVLGRFIVHCFFDAAGGDIGNGIGRLIMHFYGGFNEGKSESPITLIGMPAFGKNDHSLPSCSYCNKEYCEASGGGVVRYCDSRVYYCRDGDCKAEAVAASLLADLCLEEEKESKKKKKKLTKKGGKKNSKKR
jgi:hypothetical protein